MRAFVKIRDMQPGDASTEKEMDLRADDPECVRYVQDIAACLTKDHPEVWMVTVELHIGLACILEPPPTSPVEKE